ncbi:hypothetical protein ACA910_018101 [Epithemia clementina (nom. ined.)]
MKKMTSSVWFLHVHLYVDRLAELAEYKKLEEQLNELSKRRKSLNEENEGNNITTFMSPKKSKELWASIVTSGSCQDIKPSVMMEDEEAFLPQNRDVVRQMLAGFGFRITGARYASLGGSDSDTTHSTTATTTTSSRSLLLTSRDPNGIQVLVTAIDPINNSSDDQTMTTTREDQFHHFDASRVRTFYKEHNQRQGIAVLAFLVDNVELVYERYKEHHPDLVSHYGVFQQRLDNEVFDVKILEVFAFYRGQKGGQPREADKGTVLRFMQIPPEHQQQKHLPGMQRVDATFDELSVPAYCDHWVSNVINRTEFLDTLNETLGFDIKVDFNAVVVAAGEAQIESTVTGNHSDFSTVDKEVALRDQSQVYLPINNALSEVGHVHLFLKEIGQGVQHVASRVEDLVSFVQHVNDQRKITGEGFTFLNIPRSYYGVLTISDLEGVVSKECAQNVWNTLDKHHLLAHDGAVDLQLSRSTLDAMITESVSNSTFHNEYISNKEQVLKTILQSRYKNLYNLLRDNLSEEKYLGVVRNQILVDIQGDDLLYQIFTCKILHRNASEEAPFFEFIQRVCSECKDENGCSPKIRPGCGGFGIRNFLTLFLSIEVSKAMQAVANARVEGDEAKVQYEQTRVDYFTAQLNESNPILTEISDAMKDEGNLRQSLLTAKTPDDKENLEMQINDAAKRKQNGNMKLMAVSSKYNDMMKALRMRL